ncbi:MAG: sulfatase [Clostridia bacterium]|nr:sulfatase [Clostridia bacterium]
MKKKPNIVFIGVDSLRRSRMSLYGYSRLTTPHISDYFKDGIVFENCFSPSIPTTPGYASMLTGMDCFGTNVVALRHQGPLAEGVKNLPTVLKENGYTTTAIGYNCPISVGCDNYLEYPVSWGSWSAGRSAKAESMNSVALPELERLAKQDKPFMLFMRHMDPHSPYLPPEPFSRMFYQGDEFDKENKSLERCYKFKPFRDYFCSWFPPHCTDAEYVNAQYDGAVAYLDSCLSQIFTKIADLGIEEETIVILTSDHGETLNEHECYYDHHGLYDCTLVVPFAIRYKGHLPEGKRFSEFCQLKDIMPTLLDIIGIKSGIKFDGQSMMNLVYNTGKFAEEPEMYITEATWERKHGWRTPEWKLIRALEPDFHYREDVELYNLIKDPGENNNVAKENPEIVAALTKRLEKHLKKREKATKRTAPIYTNATTWNGIGRPFESSDEAYNKMHIGNPEDARKLQILDDDE